jgi:hypothetical protein
MGFYKCAGTRSQGLLVLKDNHVWDTRSQGGWLLVPNLIVPLGSSPFSCIDLGMVYVRSKYFLGFRFSRIKHICIYWSTMPPVSALSFPPGNLMLQSWEWVAKNYSEVAINCCRAFKSFGIICGHSTLFPAFFQPLAAFSGWSHVGNCLIWTLRGREGQRGGRFGKKWPKVFFFFFCTPPCYIRNSIRRLVNQAYRYNLIFEPE